MKRSRREAGVAVGAPRVAVHEFRRGVQAKVGKPVKVMSTPALSHALCHLWQPVSDQSGPVAGPQSERQDRFAAVVLWERVTGAHDPKRKFRALVGASESGCSANARRECVPCSTHRRCAVGTSADHAVCLHQQRSRNFDAKASSGVGIDHQFDAGRQLHRHVGRVGTTQDAIGDGRQPSKAVL